ncbi:MAG TPA: hypothetical protein VHJ76_06010 [Actinomycetota bacterium]|nr:hypothetical protein [Actinomycetota bacterium]
MSTTTSKKTAAWIAVALASALLAVSVQALPAEAGKKKKKKVERVEERQYVGATGVRGLQDNGCAGEPVGCVVFPVEPGERFVSIDVADATGEDVWASVYVYGYSDGTDIHEHVCGRSDAPFALSPGLEELVVVTTQTTGGATNPCTGPATQGTVTATFSNVR